jgi:hypothetical protein
MGYHQARIKIIKFTIFAEGIDVVNFAAGGRFRSDGELAQLCGKLMESLSRIFCENSGNTAGQKVN